MSGGNATLGLTSGIMASDPYGTDPDDRDPGERDLSRRSDNPAVSPWLIIGVIGLVGALVYVVSALL